MLQVASTTQFAGCSTSRVIELIGRYVGLLAGQPTERQRLIYRQTLVELREELRRRETE